MTAVRPTTTLKDPDYTKPYVDVDEWRDEPVRHRYVHGGFEGTDLRFSCYFPPEEQYEGRFFQPILAVSGTEHAFGSSHAARHGRLDRVRGRQRRLHGRVEPRLAHPVPRRRRRPSPATARARRPPQYSRMLAAEMYGEHRPLRLLLRRQRRRLQDDELHGEHRRVGRRRCRSSSAARCRCRTSSRCRPTPCASSGRSSRRSSTPSTPAAAATCTPG